MMSATRKNLAKIQRRICKSRGLPRKYCMHNIIRAGLPTVGAANGNVALISFVGFGFASVVTAAWMGLIGYGLIELAELAL